MALLPCDNLKACTGITLKSKDGAVVLARTIEWAGSYLDSRHVIVPRGYAQRSFLPGGADGGLKFISKYGYVGVAVEADEFVTEGINEAGLSVGLFYFPGYGGYEEYNEVFKSSTISDLQLVPWILGSFGSVDELIENFSKIHVVSVYPGASTAHWRIADASGRQVVLEIVGGKPVFHENTLGVLTNSPGFDWHIKNLNNYVNLFPGAADKKDWNGISIAPFGAGSGMLGIPGDVTPPSRFIRAAFYQMTAPVQETAEKAVLQAFHILNNFDIPVGLEFAVGQNPPDIPSATQWTSATDVTNKKFYYRSMYDSAIRCFDLNTIDFSKVKYRVERIDKVKSHPIKVITV